MGFFDKAKTQAAQLKDNEKVHELADKVKEKVGDFQHKRQADDLLDDLGRFSYAEKTGRPIEGSAPEIDRIVADLRKLEAEGVQILPD